MIANVISDKFGALRNAKQCRDRYNQFLDPEVNPEWTAQE